ncbi:DUF6114 domain-containing protein [Streptomyces brasiliensis]|uniref:Integral membrane protein n=1 Tax=Streptomyces brasiliensis TaxID=1954 RepID=A0A917JZF9_9ACTN|nr:DUF6114 domain-containing protein [Streptomyces brasiliensis]GGI93774.1 hypothetical protein GCM10010121_000150 [Streptomyces brasiliensis]
MINNFFRRQRSPRFAAADARCRFTTWRGERPFWAGLFTFKAGLPILYWPYAHLNLSGIPLALSTTSGAGSLVIGVLLMTLGLTLWYRPHHRVFAGVATLLLALISLPVANFGGLFLGLISALIGGALACAWKPPSATEPSSAATDQAPDTTPTPHEHSGS